MNRPAALTTFRRPSDFALESGATAVPFVVLIAALVTIVAAALVIGPAPAQAAYREMLPGSTQTEREIRWMWKYLGEFTHSCTASAQDCQTPELRAVVSKLNDYLPYFDTGDAKTWAGLLEFVSEKERPELFRSSTGEAHRVAVTGMTKLSKVYVNTDRMELPLDQWCGLLVHEVTHHLGYADDESRLPDRVGAVVAQHYLKQTQNSTLAQFNQPKTRVAIFNSSASARSSVSFMSWGDWTSDVDLQSSELQPICLPSEQLVREFVSAPSWRVNRFRLARGVVSIKGGGIVMGICRNPSTGSVRQSTIPLQALVDLQYPLPFDVNRWMSQTPTSIYDGVEFQPSNNPGDALFGQAATFVALSIAHEKAIVQAGEVWKTRVLLRSTDGFSPTSCQLYGAGLQYSYLKRDGLPGVQEFPTCRLTKLADKSFQVDGELPIPDTARPDAFYVPAIVMNDGVSDRVAIPVTPTFVQVVNPHARPAPVIQKIEIKGLSPATKIGFEDAHESFLADQNQMFTVEFIVGRNVAPNVTPAGAGAATYATATGGTDGLVTPTTDLWFDLDLWWYRPDQTFGVGLGTGSSISFPQVLLKTETLAVADGTRVVMTFKMPIQVSGLDIAALKFRRFYVRTNDFSWVEIELPDFRGQMVILRRYGR